MFLESASAETLEREAAEFASLDFVVSLVCEHTGLQACKSKRLKIERRQMSNTFKDRPLFVQNPNVYNGGPCREDSTEYNGSEYGGSNCHCHMCGSNGSNKNNARNHYLRAGLKPDVKKPHGDEKKKDRRRFRNIMKAQLKRELRNQDW